MTEPRTVADAILSNKRRTTRREQFLTEMDQVIPWATVEALVAPHYPKAGRGRRPLPMATMLRIYFLQQWFNLSDPQAEDLLYDSESMRRSSVRPARRSMRRRRGIPRCGRRRRGTSGTSA